VTGPYNLHGIQSGFSNGYFSLQKIQSEIDAGRPVEVYYQWSGGGSHVAQIVGYDGDQLDVFDPAYGPGPRKYSFVVAAYGLGAWTSTYAGFRRLSTIT
jgi:hypothetical protein